MLLARIYVFSQIFQTLEKKTEEIGLQRNRSIHSVYKVTNTWSLIKQYTSPKIQWAKNTADPAKQLLLQNLLQPLLPESRLVQYQIDLS